MATVTATIKATTNSQQTPGTLPGTVTPASISQSFNCNFATGTAANQVNLKHTKTYSLAGSATTIDLTSLLDDYGGAVNFARVRSLTVKNRSTTNGHICTIAPGASNGWTGLLGSGSTLILQASTTSSDAFLVLTAPNTTGWVTSGTSKTLSFDPGANTFDIDVEITGASA